MYLELISSWNKWKCVSVNKLLTFINTEKTVNTATSKLSVSSENYYTVTFISQHIYLTVIKHSE